MINLRESLAQQQVLDSMRLFASEVMPAFREPTLATDSALAAP
jgi:hypothetical protein